MGFFTTILAALRFHAGAPPVDATFRRGARAYADATVTVLGNVGNNGLSSAAGAALPVTLTLSSEAQTVLTAVGRLYGYSLSNPDTADDVWVHIYPEDSAGVTLGESSAEVNVMVPFQGGREAWFGPPGVTLSSGLSLTAGSGALSTEHGTPAGTVTATVYVVPST